MTRKSDSVTIREVARQAGVSVATVSRYINRAAPVSFETADRIEQVMRALRYTPHAAARTLATNRTHLIGLLITTFRNEFFAPLIEGIESVVQQHGYNLLVATFRAADSPNREPPLGPHNVDGLVAFADSLSDEMLARFDQSGFPVVLTYRAAPPCCAIPSVGVENTAATCDIVSHLIEAHGRRRILFMRGPSQHDDSPAREAGYAAALQAHGIRWDDNLLLPGDFIQSVAYRSLAGFLARPHPPFDAVFCGADEAAIGVLDALREAGLRVPQDVAVAGFDDQRLAAFLNPPLTTVRAPTEAIGRAACQTLFCRINGQPVEMLARLPTQPVIRQSCGCK